MQSFETNWKGDTWTSSGARNVEQRYETIMFSCESMRQSFEIRKLEMIATCCLLKYPDEAWLIRYRFLPMQKHWPHNRFEFCFFPFFILLVSFYVHSIIFVTDLLWSRGNRNGWWDNRENLLIKFDFFRWNLWREMSVTLHEERRSTSKSGMW